MEIIHRGARDGVTGSCHQLRIDDRHSLLIEVRVVPRGGGFGRRCRSGSAGYRLRHHRHSRTGLYPRAYRPCGVDSLSAGGWLQGADSLQRTFCRAAIHRADAGWQTLPIILDSPLASRITEAYRELQPFRDAEARQRLRKGPTRWSSSSC